MTSGDPVLDGARTPGGVIHTYLGYDPKHFPSPRAAPPDLAGAAFDHLLAYGSMRDLSEEELARAVRIDPSQIPRLGPSIDALIAMLRERREKILSTYETAAARREARERFQAESRRAAADAPPAMKDDLRRAIEREQIRDFERLWYRQKREDTPLARGLLRLMERLGAHYQIDAMSSKYPFTGRTPMDVERALAIKEELETIDKLLAQLEEAKKTAQLAIIDLDELSAFADDGAMEDLNRLQEQINELLREEAARQGLERAASGYRLSPRAFRLFQRRLLSEIFSELEAARSGRHSGPITGEGVVELQRTKPYEFGDPVSSIDVVQSIANAVARGAHAPADGRSPLRVSLDDVEIHHTRNTPRCATAVLLDMSGSMRYDGQYVNCKRMALALDGLIRSEYPGDFLAFFEMFTLARRRPIAEIPGLLPRPVTIHQSVVRLRADLSDPEISELRLPQHFTNIQHALRLARQTLSVQDTPNRQIVLITDGLPTAHFDGSMLYMLYPPDPRTEEATMREARACAREGMTINIFLLPSWSQSSEDVQFAHTLAEATRGRVFFTCPGKDLDRFVLWDYVSRRRRIIA